MQSCNAIHRIKKWRTMAHAAFLYCLFALWFMENNVDHVSVTFVFLFYCINNIFDERARERERDKTGNGSEFIL